MNHRNAHRKFGRNRGQRRALLSGLVVAVLKQEQVKTTLPKAKEVQPLVEKMITIAKEGGLANRRKAIAVLREESVVQKLFGPIAERYKSRKGGCTRVLKAGFRYGDAAPMAMIELVDRDVKAKGTDSGPKAEKTTEGEDAAA